VLGRGRGGDGEEFAHGAVRRARAAPRARRWRGRGPFLGAVEERPRLAAVGRAVDAVVRPGVDRRRRLGLLEEREDVARAEPADRLPPGLAAVDADEEPAGNPVVVDARVDAPGLGHVRAEREDVAVDEALVAL